MTTMTKLAAPVLLSALLISGPTAFSQQNAAPDDIFKPAATPPGPPANRLNNKQGRQAGAVAIESADLPGQPGGAGLVLSPKRATGFRYLTSAREDVRPVIVQFSDKNDGFDALQEDLTILTTRIRKAIETPPDEDAEVLTRSDATVRRATAGSSVRSIYLDGFGALVFVKTSFPLMDAPAAEQAAPEPNVDPEWNRAKQELLAEKRKALAMDVVSGQPYDAAQVETLKCQILSALKDAANIKSIKQGDFVAVTIFGPPTAAPGKASTTEPRGTVLTLRAKKSDIDAYAAGILDATKFREKTTLAAYLGNGYGVTSVNSWAKSGSVQLR